MAKLYEAQSKQFLFHTSTADETLYGGAAGGGKSYAIIWDALSFGLAHDKVRISIFRRTYPELEKSIIQDWLKFVPNKLYEYNKKEHKATLKNGSFIEFNHCELEEDVYRYQCFDKDTEILTTSGFKNVKDIKKGDTIFSLNPKTGITRKTKVTKYFEYDYKGKMIEGYGQIRFKVTPNHKMLRYYRNKLIFTEAAELPTEPKFLLTLPYLGYLYPQEFVFKSDGNNGKTIKFKAIDFAKFLGWYLSEGSLDKKRYGIRISQVKKEGRKEIIEILKKSNINYWELEESIDFCNKSLYFYLKKFGKANDKYISKTFKNYNKTFLEPLLNTIIKGDGTWYGNNRAIFVSSSKRLCEDVGEIANKCGYSTYYQIQEGNKKNSPFGQKKRYKLYIFKRVKPKKTRKIREVDYEGKIYCIETKPYHTVFIRYKGSCLWTGQSAQYDRLYFDELTTFTESIYIYLHSRCRTTNPKIKPQIKSATNPTGIGHLWVKSRFIDSAEPNKITQRIDNETNNHFTTIFIPSRVYDNKYIMEADPAYIERLMKLPEEQRKALLDGSWDIAEGQFFKEWSRHVHVIEPFKIPEFWTKACGMDWGYAQPTVILWVAFSPKNDPVHKGRAYVYKEMSLVRATDTEIKNSFKEVNGKDKIDYIACDPKLWSVTQLEKGESIASRLIEMGMPLIKADNARVSGWNVVRSYLAHDEKNLPRIQFFKNCFYTIRTIPSLIYDRNKPEDLESKGTEDHAADALRYILMTKPIAGKIPSKTRPYNSFQYWFEKIKSSKQNIPYVGSF